MDAHCYVVSVFQSIRNVRNRSDRDLALNLGFLVDDEVQDFAAGGLRRTRTRSGHFQSKCVALDGSNAPRSGLDRRGRGFNVGAASGGPCREAAHGGEAAQDNRNGRLMQEVDVPAQMLNLRLRARALPSVLPAMQREWHPKRLLTQRFSDCSDQVGMKASARALKIFPGYASFLPRVKERFLSCVHYLPQNTREAWDLEDRHQTFVVAAQMHA